VNKLNDGHSELTIFDSDLQGKLSRDILREIDESLENPLPLIMSTNEVWYEENLFSVKISKKPVDTSQRAVPGSAFGVELVYFSFYEKTDEIGKVLHSIDCDAVKVIRQKVKGKALLV